MRKKKTTLVLFSLLLSTAGGLLAQQKGNTSKKQERYEHVKEKTINKSYPANSNELSIDNSFGNVKIIASGGNEIRVKVHIEVSSDKEALAQDIFDQISVKDSHTGNKISFVTSTNSKKKSNDCKNCKSSMQINYEVQLPVTVALNVKNSFGGIELPDYRGKLSVSSQFGDVTAGALSDIKQLKVEFGKADIGSLSNFDGGFRFSEVNIQNLSGKNKIHMEFCGNTKIVLGSNITSLDLKESYSSVNLKPAGNLSATYNIRTSFGAVLDRANIGITRTDQPAKYGPDSNKEYSGKSGSGNAKIEIKSSFGNIVVGDPQPGDMNHKKKSSQGTRNGSSKQKTKSKEKTVI